MKINEMHTCCSPCPIFNVDRKLKRVSFDGEIDTSAGNKICYAEQNLLYFNFGEGSHCCIIQIAPNISCGIYLLRGNRVRQGNEKKAKGRKKKRIAQ